MNVSQYASENQRCELCGRPAIHTHHIFGGTRRLNYRSNLIRLCLGCHDGSHEMPVVGKVRCLAAKVAKGEWNEAELNEAAGLNVIGWLGTKPGTERLLKVIEAKYGRGDNRSSRDGSSDAGMASPEEGGELGEVSDGNSSC